MRTNYAAVIVCAIVYLLLGGVWFDWLFGKLALGQVCAWRKADTAARGAATGLLLWVGIASRSVYTTYVYEMRPIKLFAINEFFPLVGLCLMGGHSRSVDEKGSAADAVTT